MREKDWKKKRVSTRRRGWPRRTSIDRSHRRNGRVDRKRTYETAKVKNDWNPNGSSYNPVVVKQCTSLRSARNVTVFIDRPDTFSAVWISRARSLGALLSIVSIPPRDSLPDGYNIVIVPVDAERGAASAFCCFVPTTRLFCRLFSLQTLFRADGKQRYTVGALSDTSVLRFSQPIPLSVNKNNSKIGGGERAKRSECLFWTRTIFVVFESSWFD